MEFCEGILILQSKVMAPHRCMEPSAWRARLHGSRIQCSLNHPEALKCTCRLDTETT